MSKIFLKADCLRQPLRYCIGKRYMMLFYCRRKMKVITCSKEGQLLESFNPGIKDDLLRICANSRGQLIIPDHLHDSVTLYDPSGSPLQTIKPLCGSDHEFRYPCGVTCDCDDNIFICDVGNHRVLTFTPEGHYRSTLLNRREQKLWRPHDIFATNDGKILLTEVAQTFVKVFYFTSLHQWLQLSTLSADCPCSKWAKQMPTASRGNHVWNPFYRLWPKQNAKFCWKATYDYV